MKGKSIVLLAVALGCGAVASIGINQVLANRSQEKGPEVETSPVVVAATDIPLGELLNETQLRVEQWPREKVPEDALTDIAQALGETTKYRILKDDPIRSARLGTGTSVEELIPAGYRVMPVRVDNTDGGSNLILPGNRVDVMLYLRGNRQENVQQSVRTILEDIKVFAINNVYRNPEEGETTIAAKTVQLLVTPEQAQELALASEAGKLRLILRATDDADRPQLPEFTIAELLDVKPKGSDRKQEKGEQAPDSGLLALINEANQEPKPEPSAQPLPALGNDFSMVVINGPEANMVTFTPNNLLPVDAMSEPPAPAYVDPAGSPPAGFPGGTDRQTGPSTGGLNVDGPTGPADLNQIQGALDGLNSEE